MLLVRKSITSQALFDAAKSGVSQFHDLRDDARKAVEEVLWSDQGHVCAICERHKDKVGGTIEHFLPKTHFGANYTVDLQLNYWNLYMACAGCNGPKGDHLVPAYMFDPRFDPCSIRRLFPDKEIIRENFKLKDGKCEVAVQNPKVKGNSAFYNAWILEATLELMAQNREKLCIQREVVYSTLHGLYFRNTLPDSALIQEWRRIQDVANDSQTAFPEFVSLRLFMLREALKKRPSITKEMLA